MLDRKRLAVLATFVFMASAIASAAPARVSLKFFEGNTYSEGTLKIMLGKPKRMRSVGHGRIEPDGSLTLVQQVEEPGKPLRERRWRIREVAPGRFSGTMSEASGQVLIEEVSNRFRLRFKMKGGLDVEQWLTPDARGESARSDLTVRKFGMIVATGKAIVTKQP